MKQYLKYLAVGILASALGSGVATYIYKHNDPWYHKAKQMQVEIRKQDDKIKEQDKALGQASIEIDALGSRIDIAEGRTRYICDRTPTACQGIE